MIDLQTKLASDGATYLYRYRCSVCGGVGGCWLERADVARRNGTIHARHCAPTKETTP